MSHSIHIRPALSGDVPRILDIAARSPTAPQWNAEAYRSILTPVDTHLPLRRTLLVAADEQQVCGFAVIAVLSVVYPPEAELEGIAVDPEHRRQGIGRHLVEEAQHVAATEGADSLRLEVRAGNADAIRLYESMGYTRTGSRRAYYAHPVEDALCMQRTIPREPSRRNG